MLSLLSGMLFPPLALADFEAEPQLGFSWYFVQLTSEGGTKSFINPGFAYGGGISYGITGQIFVSIEALTSTHQGEVETLKDGAVMDYDRIFIAPYPAEISGGFPIESVTTENGDVQKITLRPRTPIDLSVTQFSFDLLWRFNDTRLRPFIKPLGAGVYIVSMRLEDEIKPQEGIYPGVNFGAGIHVLFPYRLIFGGEVKYHFVFIDEGELNGFTMISQIGMRF